MAYSEDSFLIVHPGSQNTLVSFGIKDSLAPPTYKIPTVVYKKDGIFKSAGEPSEAIHPIIKGDIVDLDAFNYFLHLVVRSITRSYPVTIGQLPLLLISSKTWSKLTVENITKYVMESIQITGFNILPSALAANFAMGSFNNCLIVDIGYEKSEITPIVDYQPLNYATTIINIGSSSINEHLSVLFPNFNPDEIEALKKSSIYEVLSHISIDEEPDLDVAKIVTSSSKPVIPQQSSTVPNAERKTNTFTYNNNTHEIGPQRFQGTSQLIAQLTQAVSSSLAKVPDLNKRQECYDNIITTGQTFRIKGLKEALLASLTSDVVVSPPTATQGVAAVINGSVAGVNLVQVPLSVKLVKAPEYFSSWKDVGFGDCCILGGMVVGKMIWGGNSSGVSGNEWLGDEYFEKGPVGIWDVTF